MKQKRYKLYEDEDYLIKTREEKQLSYEADVADILFVISMVAAERFAALLEDPSEFIHKWVQDNMQALSELEDEYVM